jgi:outer membrane protein assembly factor BamB
MDKKTEAALLKRRSAPAPEDTITQTATQTAAAAVAAPPATGWWMYHGDPEHTGYVSDSDLSVKNVGSAGFGVLHELQLGGPVLSVPSVADGFIYVGLANYQNTPDGSGNGGALHKIDIQAGTIVQTFAWNLGNDMEDTHSFTGMGSTPLLTSDRIYFGAFNGKFYCLDKETLEPVWTVDLRNEDLDHNQPVININGAPPAAVIWTSPVITADGTKVYVACGEGENPSLYSFVFCIDAASGNVNWIYCTNQYVAGEVNKPNVLPVTSVQSLCPPPGVPETPPPPQPQGYTIFDGEPFVMGCSVWGAIAYDKDLNRIYCSTGNQQPEPTNNWPGEGRFKTELPSLGFSNGVLSLDADTGEYKAFFQVLPESNYRVSDVDVDIGSAPVILELDGRKVVALTCKNGGLFILDADTLELIKWRQLLPYQNDGTWIPSVDAHPRNGNALDPHVGNNESNSTPGENFSGAFNTSAHYPGSTDQPQTISPRLFTALGGPNYHNASPGIDYESTPFMRAVDLNSDTLIDAWPLDNGDPRRYTNTFKTDPATGQTVGMYSSAGESGISSPAVVNDVVFCTTSKIAIYAFDVRDGNLLWNDDLGMQTDGYSGGYGYCLGPAIWKNYVVAGALVFGRDGGVLRIYGLLPPAPPANS